MRPTIQMRSSWWTPLMAALLACSPGARQDPAAADPSTEFANFELRLLDAESIRFGYHTTATGVVEADLTGTLEIEGPSIRLIGQGSFMGQPVDLRLESDGTEYTFGNEATPTVETDNQPPHLREAVVIGLARMGILHNLARLVGGAPPDHAMGGVRDWVTVDSLRTDAGESGPVSFDLTVAGEPVGTATLELDAHGMPVSRHLVVAFPGGEMQVEESYTNVKVLTQKP